MSITSISLMAAQAAASTLGSEDLENIIQFAQGQLAGSELSPVDQGAIEKAFGAVRSITSETPQAEVEQTLKSLDSLVASIARRGRGQPDAESGAGANGTGGTAGAGGGATLSQIYAALGSLVDDAFEPALDKVNALGPDAKQGEVLQATAALQIASAVSSAAGSAKDSVAEATSTIARNK